MPEEEEEDMKMQNRVARSEGNVRGKDSFLSRSFSGDGGSDDEDDDIGPESYRAREPSFRRNGSGGSGSATKSLALGCVACLYSLVSRGLFALAHFLDPRGLLRFYTRLSAQFGWKFVVLVTLVYGANQGVGEGWGFFAEQYFLTDDPPKGLGMQPENFTALDGFTNVPWQVKSLYGICSDTMPISGFHRGPYITAAGFAGLLSWSAIGILPASAFLAAIFLFFANYSIASPDVMIDAAVAKRCKSHPTYAADLQSLCWGSFGAGKVFALLTAGALYSGIGSRGMFILTSGTSLLLLLPNIVWWKVISFREGTDTGSRHHVASMQLLEDAGGNGDDSAAPLSDDQPRIGSCFSFTGIYLPVGFRSSKISTEWLGEEEEQPHNKCCFPPNFAPLREAMKESGQASLFRMTICVCILSLTMGLIANFAKSDVVIFCFAVLIGSAVSWIVYYYESKISKTLAKASLYIFLSGVVQPTTSVMFFWERENEDNCSGKYGSRPCFSPEFIGTVSTVGYVFFILGTAMYNKYLSSWSYKRIWISTQILLCAVNMLDLIWVLRWNVKLGISDKAFAFGDEMIVPLIKRLNTMPLFILAAKLCPDGIEATLFAMNMGLSNMGVVMGSYIGIGLLWVLGGVEKPEFDNLGWLVFIRSLTRLLPILLVPFLVPDGSPSDDDSGDSDKTSGENSSGSNDAGDALVTI